MNHRPFEDWLLDDERLTAQQERDLDAHMRHCASCTSIAESNMALRTVRQARPAQGFSERFSRRLEARRREQQWRQIVGTLVLVFGGSILMYWLAGPILMAALRSPSGWLTVAVGYFVFGITSARVLGEVGTILLGALQGLVSPRDWALLFLALAGLALVLTVSVRRWTHKPEGV